VDSARQPLCPPRSSQNLNVFPPVATARWIRLRRSLVLVDDVFAIGRPVVFPVSKDRPVLFTALASAKVLLTFDRRDFGTKLGGAFYELAIIEPADFFDRERIAGRLKNPFSN
jgi:hypothetical protein